MPNLLKEYISRLLHKTWLLATGGGGFAVSFVLEVLFPGLTYNWVLYVAILLASLIVGGYFVFADLLKQHESEKQRCSQRTAELERRVTELEEKSPRIVVGLQDETGQFTNRLRINLKPSRARPDFDALVEKKKESLLTARDRSVGGLPDMAAIMHSAMCELNPNYEEEVKRYLVEYRAYLVRKYEIELDRAYPVSPHIENHGTSPASSVTIDFKMPSDYKVPVEHQFGLKLLDHWELEAFLQPPKEPHRYKYLFDVASITMPGIPSLGFPDVEPSTDSEGPFHREGEDGCSIRYEVRKLVQHRPKDDFEPFWLWLADIHDSTSWEIPVRITAEELDRPKEGVVHLEFVVGQGPTTKE